MLAIRYRESGCAASRVPRSAYPYPRAKTSRPFRVTAIDPPGIPY